MESTRTKQPHLLIIGGGLAGLSAGCYARRNGFRTTVIEHNLALGGVCTSWPRGSYTVDGCIHWLTGGPFASVYEELGITPGVGLKTLETWVRYRDVSARFELDVTKDLNALFAALVALAPDDARELEQLHGATRAMVDLPSPIAAPELQTLRERLRSLWEMRNSVATLAHYRKPIGEYCQAHIKSATLRRMFQSLLPETAPTLILLWVLGYLERGYLSRPIGGTAAFRDALIQSYVRLGGDVLLHSTVDEVIVEDGRARGVRLADGTLLEGDAVVSTASAPETVLRLLGGRYEAAATRERLENWKLFDPIVIASFGVALPLDQAAALQIVAGVEPFDVGSTKNDRFSIRVENDDRSFAPKGHSVVQALMGTSYEWWAKCGSRYGAEKDRVAQVALAQLEPLFPGIGAAVRMVDVVTPLTFWNKTRSWRGAYEGWSPTAAAMFGHMNKTLNGLQGFYMAGQWVEPGGGVPTAIVSGRQAVELLCSDTKRSFVAAG